MAARGRAVSGALDFLGLSSKKAAAYVDKGGKRATKAIAKAGKAFDQGVASGSIRTSGIPSVVSQQRAEMARNAAIRGRQRRVGAGYVAGGAALGSVGMYKNKTGSRGGYHGPNMQAPRGSGRFA